MTEQVCEWKLDDIGGESCHETKCGHTFEFNDGDAEENGFRFCPYCGAKLVLALTSKEEGAA